ncbi:hypothetical protein DERP_008594 [Dermatophagoides pteronyssinus]|uniref:Uncharacterized protein n=1 Tax=Dermatophagoides pteronyssinus TaxID=6956 RepID=A0ABQ8IWQ0_DERPT|nr:hypothetical protein DERP_008594 [Dermatophagoides pteronyssinus]
MFSYTYDIKIINQTAKKVKHFVLSQYPYNIWPDLQEGKKIQRALPLNTCNRLKNIFIRVYCASSFISLAAIVKFKLLPTIICDFLLFVQKNP